LVDEGQFMNNMHKSTRLGDLLVERGTITHDQLCQAVALQQSRRFQAVQANEPDSYKQELGEVLIELGFINRSQLEFSLGWQKRLRKTTAVMVFIAPLLTAACGGGGGGGGGAGTNNNNTQGVTPSSQSISSQPVVDKPTVSSIASSTISSAGVSSGANSSAAVSSVGVSSSSTAPVLTSSSQSSSSVPAQGNSAEINGPVEIYWTAPNQRENGTFLDITELGGYELRYKLKSDSRFKYVTISDAYTDSHYFDHLQGKYEFQIAAFDTNGVYSAFVPVSPR
jgi:hypothetical protein